MRSGQSLTCDNGNQPQICNKACSGPLGMVPFLAQDTLLRCHADPCNECRESLKDENGRTVTLEELEMQGTVVILISVLDLLLRLLLFLGIK